MEPYRCRAWTTFRVSGQGWLDFTSSSFVTGGALGGVQGEPGGISYAIAIVQPATEWRCYTR